jgi:hypothetical protein
MMISVETILSTELSSKTQTLDQQLIERRREVSNLIKSINSTRDSARAELEKVGLGQLLREEKIAFEVHNNSKDAYAEFRRIANQTREIRELKKAVNALKEFRADLADLDEKNRRARNSQIWMGINIIGLILLLFLIIGMIQGNELSILYPVVGIWILIFLVRLGNYK